MKVFRVLLVSAISALVASAIVSEGQTQPKTEIFLMKRYVPIIEVKKEVRTVYKEIEPEPSPIAYKALGEFTITYYTAGKESTDKSPGHPEYGITKTGATVWEGVTVAVDPKVIPYGSYLYIEGIGFRVAQDKGGAIKGNKIDVYVKDVKKALQLGKHTAEVYLIKEGKTS